MPQCWLRNAAWKCLPMYKCRRSIGSMAFSCPWSTSFPPTCRVAYRSERTFPWCQWARHRPVASLACLEISGSSFGFFLKPTSTPALPPAACGTPLTSPTTHQRATVDSWQNSIINFILVPSCQHTLLLVVGPQLCSAKSPLDQLGPA